GERATRLTSRIRQLETRLSETLGEQAWHESGLAVTPTTPVTPACRSVHYTCRARYDSSISLRAKGKRSSQSPDGRLTPGEHPGDREQPDQYAPGQRPQCGPQRICGLK